MNESERLLKIHKLGGSQNQVVLAIAEGYQHEDIFKAFNAVYPAKYESSDIDYSAIDKNTIYFINCQTDFIQRYMILQRIPETTIVFFIDPREQRQELFDRGEFHRHMTVNFTNEVSQDILAEGE